MDKKKITEDEANDITHAAVERAKTLSTVAASIAKALDKIVSAGDSDDANEVTEQLRASMPPGTVISPMPTKES